MSDRPEMMIPLDRLPPGFAERVQDPPANVPAAHPAATVVLVRDGAQAPEILLLKRHRAAGFVPGAYVFPGGRVDDADAAAELVALLDSPPTTPHASYWLAAVREAFEETGVLLARDDEDVQVPDATASSDVARWRSALLDGDAALLDALRALGVRPDLSRMVYCAHWITPVAEPRRYDTRFFLAELPSGSTVSIHEAEMSDAVWLTAHNALDAFQQGTLPMVFPTVKTIQRLVPFQTVAEMLGAFRATEVPATLPRLVRTDEGVGIVVDE